MDCGSRLSYFLVSENEGYYWLLNKVYHEEMLIRHACGVNEKFMIFFKQIDSRVFVKSILQVLSITFAPQCVGILFYSKNKSLIKWGIENNAIRGIYADDGYKYFIPRLNERWKQLIRKVNYGR